MHHGSSKISVLALHHASARLAQQHYGHSCAKVAVEGVSARRRCLVVIACVRGSHNWYRSHSCYANVHAVQNTQQHVDGKTLPQCLYCQQRSMVGDKL